MSKITVDQNTYIRKLPFSVIQKVISLLEPEQLWKKLVVNVPKRLDMSDTEFEERYSDIQVRVIEEKGKKANCSATRVILDDWGTQNARVRHLLKALIKGKLYGAADFISVDVLKQGRVSHNNGENHINSNLASPVSYGTSAGDNMEKEFGKKNMYDKQIFTTSKPDSVKNSMCNGNTHGISSSVRSSTSDTSTSSNPISGSEISSSDEVIYNRIPSYDSGAPSQDLRSAPSMESVGNSQSYNPSLSTIFRPGSTVIKYSVLRDHTNNFCNRSISEGGNVIGCGGFGTVYLAIFSGDYKLAVKKLKNTEDPIMLKQFETELNTLSTYKHENIVELLGYSIDGPDKCLVYEYMLNGSLEDRLLCMNGTAPLSWQLRLEIAYGTAKGISYLNDKGMIHRDIKSANVLLDEHFTPKVGDFATARLAPSGCGATTAKTTLVIGTSAYMAPEAIRFDISSKLDSFAFGVVLLEILTGLPPNDPNRSEQDLLSFVEENIDSSVEDLLDKKAGPWCVDTADKLYQISLQCTETSKKKRVTVNQILTELEGCLPKAEPT
ncbi:hypothetical protein FSP39_011056 [Pinctada imbricata]|uniref:non-specific serine/threonine protein kinase n=1 Tax=Pinctada imbricata TaxID=66713 RepID=A0AA89BTG4_PINIB|nr:hypothetical protein FSP39_011056 [Pinctada imbricata]